MVAALSQQEAPAEMPEEPKEVGEERNYIKSSGAQPTTHLEYIDALRAYAILLAAELKAQKEKADLERAKRKAADAESIDILRRTKRAEVELKIQKEKVEQAEIELTNGHNEIFTYIPEVMPLAEKIRELTKLFDASLRREQRQKERAERAEIALEESRKALIDFSTIAELYDKPGTSITIRQGLEVWTKRHYAAIDAARQQEKESSKEGDK